MGQRLCGAEEAVGRGAVAPISFDGLQTQPLAGQQRLSAGGVTGRCRQQAPGPLLSPCFVFAEGLLLSTGLQKKPSS